MTKKLLVNRWQTPDGTILESRYRYDYKSHKDANGLFYFVDGGKDYIRLGSTYGLKDLCIYSDEPHVLIREGLTWGTLGPLGDQPVEYKPLMDLSSEHICAILDTQWQIFPAYREVLLQELAYRTIRDSIEEASCIS